MRFRISWLAAAAAITATAAPAAAQQQATQEGGYSILAGTIGDMTYTEYEAAVRRGAVALWGLGVIEEHGPHLPLATDIYGPYLQTRLARESLERRGIPALVVPVFYWGVNRVTGSFPGSIDVRPEVMIELMIDVFRSLKRDGIQTVFCVSGHGDAAHNRAIFEGVRRGAAATGIRAYFVTNRMMAERIGLPLDDPHLVLSASGPGAGGPPPAGAQAAPARPPQPDVHAGAGETSSMLGNFPEVVRDELISTLPPTNLTQEDLAEWRRGYDHARRITPQGYLGAPADANAERGRTGAQRSGEALADAIAATLRSQAGAARGSR